jgi:peptidoglycan-associated lipoprotein
LNKNIGALISKMIGGGGQMRKRSTTFTLLGIVGMALLVSQGCSQKSLRSSVGDEMGEQGIALDGTYSPGEFPQGASGSESFQPGATNSAAAHLSDNGEADPAGGQETGDAEQSADMQFYGSDGSSGTSGDGQSNNSLAQNGERQPGSQGWSYDGQQFSNEQWNGNGEYSSPRGSGPGEHDWKNGPLAGLQEMGQGGQGYTYDPFTGQSEERVNDPLAYSGVPQQGPDGEYQANAQGGGAGIQPFYGNGQGWSPYQMYQEGGTQVELQDVFFEYDSWRITQEGTQALAHDADWLGENQARSLTVEGHCDQRGTQNYNMVLGKKRAEAVRSYLIDLGVDTSQVEVISYGEERPFCMGSDDRCMQLNRRGHLALHKE